MVVQVALAGTQWYDRPVLVALWGFSSFEAMQEKAGQMDAQRLTRLLLDIALTHDISGHYSGRDEQAEMLTKAAKRWGVDAAPKKGAPAPGAQTGETEEPWLFPDAQPGSPAAKFNESLVAAK